ncbi:DgyrCDS12337 [Dimorphilus gyrociliatus]|uniref:DgyrCDS12337 n=1 Tax=Dimorphilus gyrociliatus TaxID=2664684 RepID=A0A7I8W7C2_9ANNE|nr:DgyrCDS12337 [Dimorphilus gyrociliatus]
MGWYDGWRDKPFPTLYGEKKTAVTEDILFIGFVYAICVISFSIALIIPGYPSKEIVCNIGQDWEVAHIKNASLPYKSGFRGEIHADVSVKIGLRSVNITLKGKPEEQKLVNNDSRSPVEKINYNERFSWNDEGWVQGRIGFGPAAGLVNREFRDAQIKGTPYPILWVAEYFTLDGEGIRWGRYYRQSGYYTHILIWTAFPLWIITCLLFGMVISYGGFFMILTGLVLLAANITYSSIRNPNELKIPMADDKLLTFSWGWCFTLNAINGCLCTIIGVVIIIIHTFKDEWIFRFFAKDKNREMEEIYAPKEIVRDENVLPLQRVSLAVNDQEVLEEIEGVDVKPFSDDEIFENQWMENTEVKFVKRSIFSKTARSMILRPLPFSRKTIMTLPNEFRQNQNDANEWQMNENEANEWQVDENEGTKLQQNENEGNKLQENDNDEKKQQENKLQVNPKNSDNELLRRKPSIPKKPNMNTKNLESKELKKEVDSAKEIEQGKEDLTPTPRARAKRQVVSDFQIPQDISISMDELEAQHENNNFNEKL